VDTDAPVWVSRLLSLPRWQAYCVAVGGNPAAAWELYRWNLQMCAALHEPLHWAELGLRNRLHQALRAHFGRSDWWQLTSLDLAARHKIGKALERCRQHKLVSPGPDDLVAELSFGFWVSLLASRYDRTLWVPILHRAFQPAYTGPRRLLHENLCAVLRLRNRVMHHEPIFRDGLDVDVARLERVLGLLAPQVLTDSPCMTNVRGVLSLRPASVPRRRDGRA
jgi:hypothetical protein